MDVKTGKLGAAVVYTVLGLLAAVAIIAIVTNVLVMAGGGEATLQQQKEEEKVITIMGSAKSYVAPDMFTTTLGVETFAKTATDAANENAKIMNEVIFALKTIGLTYNEIATSMYNIYPVYDEDGKNVIGFRVINMLTITTNKLDIVEKIVDESIRAGVNRIYGLNFYLSEQKVKQIKLELIKSALEDARAKADALLGPLGLKILGIKTASIVEWYEPIYKAEYSTPTIGTPIAPGMTSVAISVQVTYIIGP
ncbi:MAG: SIMPL domain-containing protein [Nitrososphaerota archaeon]|nr:SIMPL domain-containing protein [Aigarchaeota archaeon]MDW8076158.1 SIMPL domain-containing protein [Nitrososphaerota archaeon]